MSNSNKQSLLRICNWQLPIYLGVGPVEQQFLQTLEIDITIYFYQPPLGGENDNLSDTICYDTVLQKLNILLKNKSFKLIETLAKKIYDILSEHLAYQEKILVCVKKKPALIGLQGHIEYIYGDQLD